MTIMDDPGMLFGTELEDIAITPTWGDPENPDHKKPLRRNQVDAVRRLASRNHPSQRKLRVHPRRSLFHSLMGSGKTAVAGIVGTEEAQKTRKPILFLTDTIEGKRNWEEQFTPVFETLMGRSPIYGRFNDEGNLVPENSDVVVATPQLNDNHIYTHGTNHSYVGMEYGPVIVDEVDRFMSPLRVHLLNQLSYTHMIGMTGTLDRGDDPEHGHLVEQYFGKAIASYAFEDAIASGEINRPDYRLFAVNLTPILHHVITGKVKLHELNDAYTSSALNNEYARILKENYDDLTEQDPTHTRPRTVLFCKTTAHAKQMVELLQSQGFTAFPYHNRIPKKQRDEYMRQFRETQGAILVNVNMLRRTVNLPEVGLWVETAESKSLARFMQTVFRAARGQGLRQGEGARFADITTNFAQVQHIRLFIQRLHAARQRYQRDEYEPIVDDTPGARIDESVNVLARELVKIGILPETTNISSVNFDDIMERTGLKDAFFFSLRAHAAAVWSASSEDIKRHLAITLKQGATITLENGIVVPLQEDARVTIPDFLKNITRDEIGNPEFNQRQLDLLDRLSLNPLEHELELSRFGVRPVLTPKGKNSPRSGKKQLAAEDYFFGDYFFQGLYLYKEHYPDRNMGNGSPSATELGTHIPGRTPRGFPRDGEPATGYIDAPDPVQIEAMYKRARGSDLAPLSDISLTDWFQKSARHFDHALPSTQIKILNEGISFDSPLVRELLSREYISRLKNRSASLPEFPTSIENGLVTIHKGSQITTAHGVITLGSDATLSYEEMLIHDARYPTDKYQALSGNEEPRTSERISDRTLHRFLTSDYFALAYAAHTRARHKSRDYRTEDFFVENVPGGSIIETPAIRNDGQPGRFVLDRDVSIHLSVFYHELAMHFPFLPKEERELVRGMFSPFNFTTRSITPKETVAYKAMLDTIVPRDLDKEIAIFSTWVRTHKTSFYDDVISDRYKEHYQKLQRNKTGLVDDGFDHISTHDVLDHCRFLAIRYAQRVWANKVSDEDVSDLEQRLGNINWSSDHIRPQLRVPRIELLKGNAEFDRIGKKIFESIPNKHWEVFFRGMIDPELRETFGCLDYLPLYEEDKDFDVDPVEYRSLLAIEAAALFEKDFRLRELGFLSPSQEHEDVIPSGTPLTFPNGQTIHLSHDVPLLRESLRQLLGDIYSSLDDTTRQRDQYLLGYLGDRGLGGTYQAYVQMAMDYLVFKNWADSDPRDHGHTGSPDRYIVPAGTQIIVDDDLTVTLQYPVACPHALNTMRAFALRDLLPDRELADNPGYPEHPLDIAPDDFTVLTQLGHLGEHVSHALHDKPPSEFVSGILRPNKVIDEQWDYEPDVDRARERVQALTIDSRYRIIDLRPFIQRGEPPAITDGKQDLPFFD